MYMGKLLILEPIFRKPCELHQNKNKGKYLDLGWGHLQS